MTRTNSRLSSLPHLLLVEPDNLVRSTVSGVCKQLELAQVHQAASIAVAETMLELQEMDLMLVSLSEEEEAFGFMERLRAGGWTSASDLPLAVTSGAVREILVRRLQPFQVTRLLLLPYRIRDIVITIERLLESIPRHESVPSNALT